MSRKAAPRKKTPPTASNKRVRALTARLQLAQEEERKRIARELHDDLGQRMGMLAIEVAAIEKEISRQVSPKIQKRLHSLHATIDRLSDDLGRIAYLLHPPALEHLGLTVALRSLCSDFSELYGIKASCLQCPVPKSLPMEISVPLYRAAQECLHNAVKHSGATEATVVLVGTQDQIRLTVEDNGHGFSPGAVAQSRGLGFLNMQERVGALGGRVSITSRAGHGARVEIVVPRRLKK